jgi:hypothetical protein
MLNRLMFVYFILPDIDFNIRAGNTLVGYGTLEEVKGAVGRKLDVISRMRWNVFRPRQPTSSRPSMPFVHDRSRATARFRPRTSTNCARV